MSHNWSFDDFTRAALKFSRHPLAIRRLNRSAKRLRQWCAANASYSGGIVLRAKDNIDLFAQRNVCL